MLWQSPFQWQVEPETPWRWEACECGREGHREWEDMETQKGGRDRETGRGKTERDAKSQEDTKKNPSGWSRKIRKIIRGAESDLNLKSEEKQSEEQRDRRIGSERQRERVRERERETVGRERERRKEAGGTERDKQKQGNTGIGGETRGDKQRQSQREAEDRRTEKEGRDSLMGGGQGTSSLTHQTQLRGWEFCEGRWEMSTQRHYGGGWCTDPLSRKPKWP